MTTNELTLLLLTKLDGLDSRIKNKAKNAVPIVKPVLGITTIESLEINSKSSYNTLRYTFNVQCQSINRVVLNDLTDGCIKALSKYPIANYLVNFVSCRFIMGTDNQVAELTFSVDVDVLPEGIQDMFKGDPITSILLVNENCPTG